MIRTVLILILGFLAVAETTGQQKRVCITIDDLPGTSSNPEDFRVIMGQMTAYLDGHDLPAIGFVNEYKLYEKDSLQITRVDLLDRWLDAGLELGNHTYSHIYINHASIEEYQTDVLRGERMLRPMLAKRGQVPRYFRHTQLRTGPTDKYRKRLNQFLDQLGYTIAPVTFDNDEYIYARCYAWAKVNRPTMLDSIAQDYLTYMERVVTYFEQLSADYLGYQPPQILLIHANLLNADYLAPLLDIFRNRGYGFTTLDQALTDEAYNRPEGTHRRGPSWIHRWMIADGLVPPPTPPVSPFIEHLFAQIR